MTATEKGHIRAPLLLRIAPGLRAIVNYQFGEDFRHDAISGACVASVAVPVAIANAQLAGFRPEVGLYSSILPLVAYAIFGTSRGTRFPRGSDLRVSTAAAY